MPVVVAYCRAGFDAEAAEDLARIFGAMKTVVQIDVVPGRGYVIASADALALDAWTQWSTRLPPMFVRAAFVGTGPHTLVGPSPGVRPDRVAPIVAVIAAASIGAVRSVWLEFPDTNDGKALSTIARALEPRLTAVLEERGALDAECAPPPARVPHRRRERLRRRQRRGARQSVADGHRARARPVRRPVALDARSSRRRWPCSSATSTMNC